jgi:hypothetical protein
VAINYNNATLVADNENAVAVANSAAQAAAEEAERAAAAAAEEAKKFCFSSDMLVETETGAKRMDELIVGERVLTADGAVVSASPSFSE